MIHAQVSDGNIPKTEETVDVTCGNTQPISSKVLVTGASGTVGRHVVTELVARGVPVVAAGTAVAPLEALFGDTVDTVRLDLSDPDTFEQALAGVDRVFLMRPPHMGRPEDLYPFLAALAGRRIRLVCFLSLMGVEHNPFPPHHRIEKRIESLGLPYAHLRPGFFMQNLTGIHAPEIRERDEVFVPAGHSRTSFVDAADVGLAAAVLLHRPEIHAGTAHTITGPESLDYRQVAATMTEVLGRPIRYANPGFLRFRSHMVRHRKLDSAFVHVTMALYLMTRLGTAEHLSGDFERLAGRPAGTLKAFLERHADCLRPRKT